MRRPSSPRSPRSGWNSAVSITAPASIYHKGAGRRRAHFWASAPENMPVRFAVASSLFCGSRAMPLVDMTMRVLRVYHAGRDPQHRCRERALVAAGVDVTLVVPSAWPDPGSEDTLPSESFRIIELPVRRAGDVNRHVYADTEALRRVIDGTKPDVLDIHEEPFSACARQWLRAPARQLPVVMYTAQNIDKRLPPPFFGYERFAYQRVAAFYPCSRQAASVLRGKGFAGEIDAVPLGYDPTVFQVGSQSVAVGEIVLLLSGRLVPEKGADDAVRVLARVHAVRPARLVVSGRGPEEARVRRLAEALGVIDRIEFRGWQAGPDLASDYRAAHVLLVPSRPTTVAEQFGRAIIEAQASGAVVAGYACGAIPETAGNAGLIVPVGDAPQLADSVLRLVGDSADFARRQAAGRRQAEARTWQAVAATQLSLYERVTDRPRVALALPRSPRRRRAAARAEFGSTASTPGGTRPFALPVLRRGGAVARVLAALTDVTAELAAFVARETRSIATRENTGRSQ
jgi:glycosyltransferase involved in cell wall biosynthesis